MAPLGAGVPSEVIASKDTDCENLANEQAASGFDPQLYFEFRLYKDSRAASRTNGSAMESTLPLLPGRELSGFGMSSGGIFAWPDGRENPDTFQALFTYSRGTLVIFTSFGK